MHLTSQLFCNAQDGIGLRYHQTAQASSTSVLAITTVLLWLFVLSVQLCCLSLLAVGMTYPLANDDQKMLNLIALYLLALLQIIQFFIKIFMLYIISIYSVNVHSYVHT